MLEIERATIKDHGVVTNLLLDFSEAQGWKPEVDLDRWERVLAELLDSDSWLFLLAREDAEPVGLAAVEVHLSLYGSRQQSRLVALMVDGEHRRRGIGTSLMDSVIAAARRRGCRELEASIDLSAEGIAGFYRRFGNARERVLVTWPCEQ